ncbi:MAG: hypothetical protein JOZ83_08705 [Silvibacterium sp.]|nr:hypothetical protein [Silvibacterium sp.]
MSDGGIGNGLDYWANISISGDLDSKELKKVIAEIEKVLSSKIDGKPVEGKIVSEARASSKVTFNANFSPPKKP